ncbi:hypothetical protein N7528_003971 [Penicillium herquei]|nr:hypothetical protein N7528_003971 [Penicillium herquei]
MATTIPAAASSGSLHPLRERGNCSQHRLSTRRECIMMFANTVRRGRIEITGRPRHTSATTCSQLNRAQTI